MRIPISQSVPDAAGAFLSNAPLAAASAKADFWRQVQGVGRLVQRSAREDLARQQAYEEEMNRRRDHLTTTNLISEADFAGRQRASEIFEQAKTGVDETGQDPFRTYGDLWSQWAQKNYEQFASRVPPDFQADFDNAYQRNISGWVTEDGEPIPGVLFAQLRQTMLDSESKIRRDLAEKAIMGQVAKGDLDVSESWLNGQMEAISDPADKIALNDEFYRQLAIQAAESGDFDSATHAAEKMLDGPSRVAAQNQVRVQRSMFEQAQKEAAEDAGWGLLLGGVSPETAGDVKRQIESIEGIGNEAKFKLMAKVDELAIVEPPKYTSDQMRVGMTDLLIQMSKDEIGRRQALEQARSMFYGRVKPEDYEQLEAKIYGETNSDIADWQARGAAIIRAELEKRQARINEDPKLRRIQYPSQNDFETTTREIVDLLPIVTNADVDLAVARIRNQFDPWVSAQADELLSPDTLLQEAMKRVDEEWAKIAPLDAKSELQQPAPGISPQPATDRSQVPVSPAERDRQAKVSKAVEILPAMRESVTKIYAVPAVLDDADLSVILDDPQQAEPMFADMSPEMRDANIGRLIELQQERDRADKAADYRSWAGADVELGQSLERGKLALINGAAQTARAIYRWTHRDDKPNGLVGEVLENWAASAGHDLKSHDEKWEGKTDSPVMQFVMTTLGESGPYMVGLMTPLTALPTLGAVATGVFGNTVGQKLEEGKSLSTATKWGVFETVFQGTLMALQARLLTAGKGSEIVRQAWAKGFKSAIPKVIEKPLGVGLDLAAQAALDATQEVGGVVPFLDTSDYRTAVNQLLDAAGRGSAEGFVIYVALGLPGVGASNGSAADIGSGGLKRPIGTRSMPDGKIEFKFRSEQAAQQAAVRMAQTANEMGIFQPDVRVVGDTVVTTVKSRLPIPPARPGDLTARARIIDQQVYVYERLTQESDAGQKARLIKALEALAKQRHELEGKNGLPDTIVPPEWVAMQKAKNDAELSEIYDRVLEGDPQAVDKANEILSRSRIEWGADGNPVFRPLESVDALLEKVQGGDKRALRDLQAGRTLEAAEYRPAQLQEPGPTAEQVRLPDGETIELTVEPDVYQELLNRASSGSQDALKKLRDMAPGLETYEALLDRVGDGDQDAIDALRYGIYREDRPSDLPKLFQFDDLGDVELSGVERVLVEAAIKEADAAKTVEAETVVEPEQPAQAAEPFVAKPLPDSDPIVKFLTRYDKKGGRAKKFKEGLYSEQEMNEAKAQMQAEAGKDTSSRSIGGRKAAQTRALREAQVAEESGMPSVVRKRLMRDVVDEIKRDTLYEVYASENQSRITAFQPGRKLLVTAGELSEINAMASELGADAGAFRNMFTTDRALGRSWDETAVEVSASLNQPQMTWDEFVNYVKDVVTWQRSKFDRAAFEKAADGSPVLAILAVKLDALKRGYDGQQINRIVREMGSDYDIDVDDLILKDYPDEPQKAAGSGPVSEGGKEVGGQAAEEPPVSDAEAEAGLARSDPTLTPGGAIIPDDVDLFGRAVWRGMSGEQLDLPMEIGVKPPADMPGQAVMDLGAGKGEPQGPIISFDGKDYQRGPNGKWYEVLDNGKLGEEASDSAKAVLDKINRMGGFADLSVLSDLWRAAKKTGAPIFQWGGDILTPKYQEAWRYAARAGEPGIKLSKDLRDVQYRLYAGREGMYGVEASRIHLGEIFAGMTRDERIQAAKLSSQEISPDSVGPKVKAAREAMDAFLRQVIPWAQKAGLTRRKDGPHKQAVFNFVRGGEKPFPRILSQFGHEILSNPDKHPSAIAWARKVAAEGHYEGSVEQALLALRSYRESQFSHRQATLMDYRKLIDPPAEWFNWDPIEVLPITRMRELMVIEGALKWGAGAKGQDLFPGLVKAIEQIRVKEPVVAANMESYLKHAFGFERPDPKLVAIGKGLSAVNYYTKLAFSALSVTIQTLERLPALGRTVGLDPLLAGRVLRDYPPIVNAWIKSAQTLETNLIKAGVIMGFGSAYDAEVGTVKGAAKKAVNLFPLANLGSQVTMATAHWYKLQADLAAAERLGGEPRSWARRALDAVTGNTEKALAERNKLLQDPEGNPVSLNQLNDLVKTKGLDDPEVRNIVYRFLHDCVVSESHPMLLATKAVWFDQMPIMRHMVQFKPWAVRQTQMIWNDVVKYTLRTGDPSRAIGFMAGGIMAGEIYNWVRDWLYGSDRSIASKTQQGSDAWAIAKAVGQDLMDGGVLGILATTTYGLASGAAGPTISNFSETIGAAVAAVKQPETAGQAFYQSAKRLVPPLRQFEGLARNIGDILKDSTEETWLPEYYRWRSRGYAYKKGVDWSEKPLNVSLGYWAEDAIYGPERFRTGPNYIGKRAIVHNVISRDLEGAAEMMRTLFNIATDKKAFVTEMRRMRTDHAPMGHVEQKRMRAFMQTLDPKAQAEAQLIQRRWMEDFTQAMALAGLIRQAVSEDGNTVIEKTTPSYELVTPVYEDQ